MNQAPVLRGSLADSLPSDLRELATWLNHKIKSHERPRCPKCQARAHVVYGPKEHALFWGCPRYQTCGAELRPTNPEKLFAYATKRLSHSPRNYYRSRS